MDNGRQCRASLNVLKQDNMGGKLQGNEIEDLPVSILQQAEVSSQPGVQKHPVVETQRVRFTSATTQLLPLPLAWLSPLMPFLSPNQQWTPPSPPSLPHPFLYLPYSCSLTHSPTLLPFHPPLLTPPPPPPVLCTSLTALPTSDMVFCM